MVGRSALLTSALVLPVSEVNRKVFLRALLVSFWLGGTGASLLTGSLRKRFFIVCLTLLPPLGLDCLDGNFLLIFSSAVLTTGHHFHNLPDRIQHWYFMSIPEYIGILPQLHLSPFIFRRVRWPFFFFVFEWVSGDSRHISKKRRMWWGGDSF